MQRKLNNANNFLPNDIHTPSVQRCKLKLILIINQIRIKINCKVLPLLTR